MGIKSRCPNLECRLQIIVMEKGSEEEREALLRCWDEEVIRQT